MTFPRIFSLIVVLTLGVLFFGALPASAGRIACCGMEDGTFRSATLDGSSTCSTALGPRFTEADPKYCPDIGISSSTPITDTQVNFTPNVGIPGSDQFQGGKAQAVTGTTLGEWIAAVYAFLSGVIAIIAAVMVMWGGFKWLTAAGNSGRVSDAKDVIYSAIIAILLTLGAFILLRTINPDLVKIQDFTSLIKPVATIQQQSTNEVPLRVSEAILLNPAFATEKDAFNGQGCPTFAEMDAGFEVYLTGYYRPAWNDKGGYSSFSCNIGMQCDCKRDATSQRCSAGSLSWPPCDMNEISPSNYCNSTASGGAPVEYQGSASSAYYTAAASSCFGMGTQFTLAKTTDGSPSAADASVFHAKWSVQDVGKDIRGRHLDLFFGTGAPARALALSITGRAVLKVQRYCTNAKQPRCYDNLLLPVPAP